MSKCPIGHRCHVRGAGIDRFGEKFPADLIFHLASSSVQLVHSKVGRLASGTLIWPNVVLCAGHTLGEPGGTHVEPTDLEVMLFYECDSKTAPGPGTSFTTCTTLASEPQAKVTKLLENGLDSENNPLDFALLSIEWLHAEDQGGKRIVKLPRSLSIPVPFGRITSDIVAIGHPDKLRGKGEPTQV